MEALVAEKIPNMLQTRLSMHHPHVHPLAPSPLILFLHRPVRSAWGPAYDGTTGLACGAVAGGRRAPPKGVEDGRRIAFLGLGADRRQIPRTETLLGSVHHGPGWFLAPFADAERPDQFAVGGDRRLVPQGASLGALLHRAALRLFVTQLHGAAHSTARGVPARPRPAWHRSAWRPAVRSSRATVSVATWPRRAVARTPPPSPRGATTAAAR